ncbi:MAG: class I SAM-dependent methyltransferase family protein [Candidatus Bathyarchaeia archaeon]
MSPDLRAELRTLLPPDKISLVTKSFDLYGSKQKAVAIVEIPDELRDFEQEIGKALMRVNKNVSSVLAKESARTGEYRIRELRLITGDPDTEVLHRESGCVFRLDPRTVYFSPRESRERDRLTETMNDGDEILVMFSGVGPLPIRITKGRPTVTATAVELNPAAHNYCIENIHLNRVSDRVQAIEGDVREVCPELGKTYDRIMMPLPKGAYKFLDVAVPLLKDGGVLHLYHWASQADAFSEAEKLIEEAANECGRSAEFLGRTRVSQYSPGTWKVRVDARLSTNRSA